jgi:hypothetical protein
VVLAAVIHASPAIVAGSNHEWNMKYVDVIRVYRATYASIERHLERASSRACVLTVWPHTLQLSRPHLGYVTSPIPVVGFRHDSAAAEPACDLILWSHPAHALKDALRAYADANGYVLAERLADGPIVAELYRRAEPRR